MFNTRWTVHNWPNTHGFTISCHASWPTMIGISFNSTHAGIYCPGHAGVKGFCIIIIIIIIIYWRLTAPSIAQGLKESREMAEQIKWLVKQSSQMANVSEYLNCWGAWDTTCGHTANQGHHTIDDLDERGVDKKTHQKTTPVDDLPWKDEPGPLATRPTSEPFPKQLMEKNLLFFGVHFVPIGTTRCTHKKRRRKRTG